MSVNISFPLNVDISNITIPSNHNIYLGGAKVAMEITTNSLKFIVSPNSGCLELMIDMGTLTLTSPNIMTNTIEETVWVHTAKPTSSVTAVASQAKGKFVVPTYSSSVIAEAI